MSMSTADDLYHIAKSLPVTERLRLVEKIAHDLTDASTLAVAPPPPAEVASAPDHDERDELYSRAEQAMTPEVRRRLLAVHDALEKLDG
jgi:hypothetical protein